MHIWDKRAFNLPIAGDKLWRDAGLQGTEQQPPGRVRAVTEPVLPAGMGQTEQDRGLGEPGRGRGRTGRKQGAQQPAGPPALQP